MIGYVISGMLLSGMLSVVLYFVFDGMREKNDSQQSIELGIQILLEWSIRKECRYYIQMNEISKQDLNNLNRMWNIYHNQLKGNGYLDYLMSKVNKLTIYDDTNK